MIRTAFILMLTLQVVTGRAQKLLTWDELSEVSFDSHYDAETGIDILTATFSPHLQALDSQVVTLTGFMIPLNPMGTSYVLSRFPNANCFFCGGAGPETIVELRLAPRYVRRYATDTYATFEGLLRLNTDNISSFHYVLMNAARKD